MFAGSAAGGASHELSPAVAVPISPALLPEDLFTLDPEELDLLLPEEPDEPPEEAFPEALADE